MSKRHIARVYDATLTDLKPADRYVVVSKRAEFAERNAEIDRTRHIRLAAKKQSRSERRQRITQTGTLLKYIQSDHAWFASTGRGVIEHYPRSRWKRKRVAEQNALLLAWMRQAQGEPEEEIGPRFADAAVMGAKEESEAA